MNETTNRYLDTPIDVKLRLSALWIATMFIYAYVDIFSKMRADVIEGLLDNEIVGTPFTVNQGFLVFALVYVLPASLMVYFSLTLAPKANRRANLIAVGFYAVTVAGSMIGEDWIYYLLGSIVELVLFVVIARTAWRWPVVETATDPADVHTERVPARL